MGCWRAVVILGPPGLTNVTGGVVVVVVVVAGAVGEVLLAASLVHDAQPPQKKGTPSDTVTAHESAAVMTVAV